MSYWKWLIRGQGGRPGILRFCDVWFVVHLLVGSLLAVTVPVSLRIAANTLVLPIAAIFIGLSFAWGGNAQALLQTEEMEELSEYREGGYEEYVHTYQSAILVILVTLSLWGLAGLGMFDEVWPTSRAAGAYDVLSCVLYGLVSLTVRECWHVVLGAQLMLLSRWRIRRERKQTHSTSGSRRDHTAEEPVERSAAVNEQDSA